MIDGGAQLAIDVTGSDQAQPFQAVGSDGERRAEFAQFHGGVHHDDVGKIDGAAFPACARIGSPVGDAFHLRENFLIETVQEEGGGGGARQVPALVLAFGIQFGGAALHVLRDLFGHQMAVLVAALVGLAFDVEVDPSADRVAIGGAIGVTAAGAGQGSTPGASSTETPENHAFAVKCSAVGDREHDTVLRTRGGESQMDAGSNRACRPAIPIAHRRAGTPC